MIRVSCYRYPQTNEVRKSDRNLVPRALHVGATHAEGLGDEVAIHAVVKQWKLIKLN